MGLLWLANSVKLNSAIAAFFGTSRVTLERDAYARPNALCDSALPRRLTRIDQEVRSALQYQGVIV